MLTYLSLKNEYANVLVNLNIATRLNDWIYWVLVDILSEYDYHWNQKSDTITTASGTAEYFLNMRCGTILDEMFDETNNNIIYKTDLMKMYREEPTPTETGTPNKWAYVREDEVQGVTTAASVVTLSSSSAADTSIVVVVRGRVSGVDRYEEVTLNGTNSVATTLSFDAGTIESIVLSGAAVGIVTATATSGTITLAQIPVGYLRVQCPRIRFWYVPGSALTIRYFYQQKAVRPYRDNDIIDIPDVAFKALRYGIEEIGHINNGDQDYAQAAQGKYAKAKHDLFLWSTRYLKTDEIKDYRPNAAFGFRLPDVITGSIVA